MNKRTGGPAFPHGEALCYETSTIVSASTGMTLRDYFAAQALPIAAQFKRDTEKAWPGWASISLSAYNIADAMLEAREVQLNKHGAPM